MSRPTYEELVACLRVLSGTDGMNDFNCADCCCDVERTGHSDDCRVGNLLARIDAPADGEGDDRVAELEKRVTSLSEKVEVVRRKLARLSQP